MTRHTLVLLATALGGLSGRPAHAQAPSDLLARGIEAYQNVEYGIAAALLRRELARRPSRDLPEPEQARALVYLGAADLFRGRRDSAAAVFRRLVNLQPRFRPNPLIFPPEVTTVFDAVRRESRVVAVAVPRDTQIAAGVDAFAVRLVAASSHAVEVALRHDDGTPFRTLYSGLVGDSITVSWDGLDQAGATPRPGSLVLRIGSRASSGEVVREVLIPLQIRVVGVDTLMWPSPPSAGQLRPERLSGGPAARAVIGGTVLSGAVLVLPTLFGGRTDAHGARLAVAGTIGLTGVLGLIVKRPGRPLSANIQVNRALREAWQRSVDVVKLENARRLRALRLVIRAGEPNVIESQGR